MSRPLPVHVRRAYGDAGYGEADVEPRLDLDRDRFLVHVRVPIHRGPLVRVDEVRVRGLTTVPEARMPGPYSPLGVRRRYH